MAILVTSPHHQNKELLLTPGCASIGLSVLWLRGISASLVAIGIYGKPFIFLCFFFQNCTNATKNDITCKCSAPSPSKTQYFHPARINSSRSGSQNARTLMHLQFYNSRLAGPVPSLPQRHALYLAPYPPIGILCLEWYSRLHYQSKLKCLPELILHRCSKLPSPAI